MTASGSQRLRLEITHAANYDERNPIVMGQRPAIWSVETADQRCRAIDAAERERTLIEKWTQVAAEASKLKLLPHLHSRRLFLPQVHYLSARRLLIRIEGAQSPSAPSGTEVGDGSFFRLSVFLKPLCDVQKGAKQSGAIIVDEFDQPGLLTRPPSSMRWRVRSRRFRTHCRVSSRARAASVLFLCTVRRRSSGAELLLSEGHGAGLLVEGFFPRLPPS
jgi:hypothetical protein